MSVDKGGKSSIRDLEKIEDGKDVVPALKRAPWGPRDCDIHWPTKPWVSPQESAMHQVRSSGDLTSDQLKRKLHSCTVT